MPNTECKSAANPVHWYDYLDFLSLGATSDHKLCIAPEHVHVFGPVMLHSNHTYYTHAAYRAETKLWLVLIVVNMPFYLSC